MGHICFLNATFGPRCNYFKKLSFIGKSVTASPKSITLIEKTGPAKCQQLLCERACGLQVQETPVKE